MTDLISNYLSVKVICIFALIILAQAVMHNVLFSSNMKKQFALAALIAIAVIAAELVSVVYENVHNAGRFQALIANTIGFSLSPFIAIVLSRAFSVGKGKVISLLSGFVWINCLLVISSPWTGMVFYISADNSYLRGPLFGVYVLAYLCSYAILIIDSIKAMKFYQCHEKSTFIMLLVFTIVGTTVQLLLPFVHVAWLCVTLSLILFYAYFCVLTETQDTLTGLLDRNVYGWYIKNLHKNARGVVIVFDLDGFKIINDKYGHYWGDICLEMIGGLIKECFHNMGFCYRIGGDEFSVICKTVDEQQVEEAIRKFHHMVDEKRKSGNLQHEFPMVSTGYAVFDGSTIDFYTAAKNADAHMYIYKNNSKESRGVINDSSSK
jgi:diguanylate cyclase (GGDEF)-like protein